MARKRVSVALDHDVLLYLEWSAAIAGSSVPARANLLLRMVMTQELRRWHVADSFLAWKLSADRSAGLVPLDKEVKLDR